MRQPFVVEDLGGAVLVSQRVSETQRIAVGAGRDLNISDAPARQGHPPVGVS